jgi:ABC-type polysaccharide/polyol phosphate transport system ATPase subunit
MRSAVAPPGAGPSGADPETGILVEGVSKRYPGRRVLIFPPVLSIFERDLSLFGRRRASADAEQDTRKRPYAGDDYDLDDEDEEDDEDEDDDRDRELEDGFPPARARPDEMFWALRDISLQVSPGSALGVLGGPGAGKSTLLRILCGRSLPTEGRVLVNGLVAPTPAEFQKALAVSGKQGDDLVLASRLLGVEPQLVKQHQDEIEELAQPLLTPDGDPVRGARMRLAIATTAVLPASVILLEELRGLDETFTERVFERLRERKRSGSSLVLASRNREFVQELCDEVIVLHEGEIVDRGDAKQTVGRYETAPKGRKDAKVGGSAKGRTQAVTAFNGSAALLFAEVRTATGVRSKRLDADDELLVEIRLETAAPDTEVRCGVCFTPRTGETGLRLELPEPVRLADPRTYVLVARILPGTLRSGGYEVRADAIVANGAEGEASVIARDIGRLRIVGDELPAAVAEPPVVHWDGRAAWRVEAEWSIE